MAVVVPVMLALAGAPTNAIMAPNCVVALPNAVALGLLALSDPVNPTIKLALL